MKKILLTTSEFTNQQNEVKKKRANVGRIHAYTDGGEAIVLDAAMCAVIGAMGQKAMNAGEDSVWLSIFEEEKQAQGSQGQGSYPQQAPQMTNPHHQPPQQQQQYQQPPSPVNNNGFTG
jgi:hypothetical protein